MYLGRMEKITCDFCGADRNPGKRGTEIHFKVSIFCSMSDETDLEMDACNECYLRVRHSLGRLQREKK